MDPKTIELTIDDMSVEGHGIGRTRDGMVVFVEGALKGDKVRAEITRLKKRFAFAKATEILEGSPLREKDFDCPYHREGCGGCPFGELSYHAQLEIKEGHVRDRLERIAGIDPDTPGLIRPIQGMKEEDNDHQGCWRYRDKATFNVSTGGIVTKKGGIVEAAGSPSVGFYRAGSKETFDCLDCYLQTMAAMAAADALRCFMVEDNITGYDPRWKKGLIRSMIVKTAFATGEVMVVILINGKGIPGEGKLAAMLDERIEVAGYSLESIVVGVKRDDRSNAVRYETIAGKGTITDEVGSLKFEISPASFFQVNPVQMKRLYDMVRAYVEDASRDGRRPVVCDLYCGVGSIGLYCADLAEMIIGVESVREAVLDANRNAVINGIVNARYICGRAEEVLKECVFGTGRETAGAEPDDDKVDLELAGWIRRTDIAILDPPRAGCSRDLLDAVAFADIPRIVYVSCDPATLARDLKHLRDLGYEPLEVTPLDMFPQTRHVEAVTLLSRGK